MTFRRSSYCGTDHVSEQCVEVDTAGSEVYVRDSKDPDGPVLVFSHDEFAAFVLAVQAGEFDDLA